MPKKKKPPATEGVQTGVSEAVVFGIMMWRLRDTLPNAHEIDPGYPCSHSMYERQSSSKDHKNCQSAS